MKRFCLLLLALFLILPLPVAAEVGSLTINFPFDGLEFQLYRVGSMESGFDPAFSSVSSAGIEDPEVAAAAAARLAPLAESSSVTPAEAAVADGKAAFSNLSTGLYLLTAPTFRDTETGGDYYVVPMLLSVPGRSIDQESLWNQTVDAKYTGELELSVVKLWKNDYSYLRPASIQVQLKKDGQVVGDPVTLSPANSWTHTWTGLAPTGEYTVAELTTLTNYTTDIKRVDNVFQVTNTRNTPPTTPSTGNKLPQTGQLWWPVTALGLAGSFLLILGILKKRGADQ